MFNFKTRFILRISGLPKMNFLRKFLWKMSSQKIYKVICPTEATYLDLLNNGIFEKGKLCIVNDPVLVSSEIVKNKSKFFDTDKIVEANKNKFILGIGRLSKQKNFNFLIKNFVDIKKKYPFLKLIILGEGEERKKLEQLILQNNLTEHVFLIGHKNNIFYYLKNCFCFVLSSLWEDPGFVLVEAAYSNALVFSSNCRNGPQEILDNGNRGYLFKSNDSYDFLKSFENFMIDKDNYKKKKFLLKKYCKSFSIFNHYLKLDELLN